MARKKKTDGFVPEVVEGYDAALAAVKEAVPAPQPGLPDGVVWRGNPALIPFLIAVDELFEDPANANTHPERSIASIAASYNRFGQQKPLVCDENLTVRDGNGQLMAARERLGWTHLAVLPSELGGVEMSAYALAVNRTAQHAEWDFENLASQLKALRDSDVPIHDLGWADYELEPLLAAQWTPPAVAPLPDTDGAGDGTCGGGQPGEDAAPIRLSAAQREQFDRAAELVRHLEDKDDLADGACLALLASFFLAQQGDPPADADDPEAHDV